MNRRTFFRRLCVTACLSLAAPFLSFKRNKKPKPSGPIPPFKLIKNTAVINPEWQTAPYEFSFYTAADYVISDPWPHRFRDEESARAWIAEQIKLEYRLHKLS